MTARGTYTDSVTAGSKAGAHLTHAVEYATGEALCGRVRRENLCGDPTVQADRPTCPVCRRKLERRNP